MKELARNSLPLTGKRPSDISPDAPAQRSWPEWQDFCPFWPAEFADRYRREGLWRDETFFDMLETSARARPVQVAVIDGTRSLTHTGLRDHALNLAAGLAAADLRRGDRVVVQLPNCVEFLELLFGLLRLGVVPVLALPAHRDREIGQFVSFSQARAVFVAQEPGGYDMVGMARRIREANPLLEHIFVLGDAQGEADFETLREAGQVALPDGPEAEDVACFQISGGTTGVPKLIPRRHMEYLYNIRTAAAAGGLSGATRYLCALPVAHNFPLACPGVLGTLFQGGTVVMARDPGAAACFALIAQHRVDVTALVPPLALAWLDARARSDADLSSLRVLQVGGAKLNPSSARRVRPELGCRLQQVFGMAEGLICFTGLDDAEERITNTQGRPMSAFDEVRIILADGTRAGPGQTGQLQVRGPYTIRGYFNLPDKSAEAITGDGFYCSGDIARQDADGSITVEGRDKDQVNRGGEKIGVDEIEDLLVGHEGVLDAAVVGRPDEALGEKLCAFVILADQSPVSPAAQRRHLAGLGLAGSCPRST